MLHFPEVFIEVLFLPLLPSLVKPCPLVVEPYPLEPSLVKPYPFVTFEAAGNQMTFEPVATASTSSKVVALLLSFASEVVLPLTSEVVLPLALVLPLA